MVPSYYSGIGKALSEAQALAQFVQKSLGKKHKMQELMQLRGVTSA